MASCMILTLLVFHFEATKKNCFAEIKKCFFERQDEEGERQVSGRG